jgi:hypothetical protein
MVAPSFTLCPSNPLLFVVDVEKPGVAVDFVVDVDELMDFSLLLSSLCC